MDEQVPLLNAHQRHKLVQFLKQCFPQYALVMDGSPFFAKAECIVIRLVHKYSKRIYQLVICVGLLAGSLDGATLDEHVVETLKRVMKGIQAWTYLIAGLLPLTVLELIRRQ